MTPTRTPCTAALPRGSRGARGPRAGRPCGRPQRLERLAQTGRSPGPAGLDGRPPAYTVRISPKHDGGLLGAGELAWDAAKGLPLRAAIYAQGQRAGARAQGDRHLLRPGAGRPRSPRPGGAEEVEVDPPAPTRRPSTRQHDVTGVGPCSRRLPFKLSAPRARRPARHEVRLVRFEGREGGRADAYGQGLGGVLVLQRRPSAPAASARATRRCSCRRSTSTARPARSSTPRWRR